MNNLIPLSLSMVSGVQLILAILLITSKNNVRASLAYAVGITLAVLSGTYIFYYFSDKILKIFPQHKLQSPDIVLVIQIILVLILVFMAIRTYVKRKTATMPKWLVELENMGTIQSFLVGIGIILLFPGSDVIMLSVALNLARTEADPMAILYFGLTTGFIIAIPLIFYFLMQQKAVQLLPTIRTWIENHSWVVSIVSYLVFIVLVLMA